MGDARGKKDDDDCVQESTFSFFFFFFLSSLSLDIWTPKGKEGRSLASLQRQKNRGCCFHCDLKGTEKGRAEKEVGKGRVVEKRALSGKGGGGKEGKTPRPPLSSLLSARRPSEEEEEEEEEDRLRRKTASSSLSRWWKELAKRERGEKGKTDHRKTKDWV